VTEHLLASVWAKELGLEKVSVSDNFFDIGGHSLVLIRIQAKLNQSLGRHVSIVEMFQFPTIHALANHLTQPSTESDRMQRIQERAQRRARALGEHRPLLEAQR
jgi:aryl carrier-like protein